MQSALDDIIQVHQPSSLLDSRVHDIQVQRCARLVVKWYQFDIATVGELVDELNRVFGELIFSHEDVQALLLDLGIGHSRFDLLESRSIFDQSLEFSFSQEHNAENGPAEIMDTEADENMDTESSDRKNEMQSDINGNHGIQSDLSSDIGGHENARPSAGSEENAEHDMESDELDELPLESGEEGDARSTIQEMYLNSAAYRPDEVIHADNGDPVMDMSSLRSILQPGSYVEAQIITGYSALLNQRSSTISNDRPANDVVRTRFRIMDSLFL